MLADSQNAQDSIKGQAEEPSGANSLLQAIEIIMQEFRRDRDYYSLQKRCEALSQLLEGDFHSTMDWIAAQAELIDCRLINDSPEDLAEVLRQLALRLR